MEKPTREDSQAQGTLRADELEGIRLRGSSTKTRKSTETRKRIMDAASELMIARGGTDFQMSEVSSRCNMSKGALYYYFADREELIQAVFAEAIERSVKTAEALVGRSSTAEEALYALCLDFCRQLQSGSVLALAVAYEYSNATTNVMSFMQKHFARAAALFTEQLERAKAEGFIRQDVDSVLSATFLVGGFVMTSLATTKKGIEVDTEKFASDLFEMGLHGLGAKQ